jgi:hypothetical protein
MFIVAAVEYRGGDQDLLNAEVLIPCEWPQFAVRLYRLAPSVLFSK